MTVDSSPLDVFVFSLAVNDEEEDAGVDEIKENENGGKDQAGELVDPRGVVAYSLAEFAHSSLAQLVRGHHLTAAVASAAIAIAAVVVQMVQLFFNAARMNGRPSAATTTNDHHSVAVNAALTDGR